MKDDILQDYWVTYLQYWKQEVKDVSKPPTEDDFWVWYALGELDKKPTQLTSEDIAM